VTVAASAEASAKANAKTTGAVRTMLSSKIANTAERSAAAEAVSSRSFKFRTWAHLSPLAVATKRTFHCKINNFGRNLISDNGSSSDHSIITAMPAVESAAAFPVA
jgi:hypothetical protein